MNQSQKPFTASNIEQLARVLSNYLPQSGQPEQADLRGFEWRFFYRPFHNYVFSRRPSPGAELGFYRRKSQSSAAIDTN
jgi:hypothetical protein